ncbi:DUF5675 family protein [Pseudomonas sp. HY13-MNA-CIBAN-0226]|uniref:DUF5675 family protein n=1 Tax=Pseudomonas sp. HY13-MNA-CIBAN-0226 TaxID=3140473 RepID=UPI00333025A0
MKPQFRIQLMRILPSPDAIMGELYVNGQLVAFTLELPWKDNKPDISSIPDGEYGCTLRYDKSRDTNFTIQLEGTGPRSGVQVHVGNRPDDSSGCILVGLNAKYSKNLIGSSRDAIVKLKNIFYGSENPIACPDLLINIKIQSIPQSLRYYPTYTEKSYYFTYGNGAWNIAGGTAAARYEDIIRDLKWIISKSPEDSSIKGRYVRWGILGGTAMQISKDLKYWTTVAPDDLFTREPILKDSFWEKLKTQGMGLKSLLESSKSAPPNLIQFDHVSPEPGPPDPVSDADDGNNDGIIELDMTGDNEGAVVDMDQADTYDDYSDYDDRDDGDDGGGDSRDGD